MLRSARTRDPSYDSHTLLPIPSFAWFLWSANPVTESTENHRSSNDGLFPIDGDLRSYDLFPPRTRAVEKIYRTILVDRGFLSKNGIENVERNFLVLGRIDLETGRLRVYFARVPTDRVRARFARKIVSFRGFDLRFSKFRRERRPLERNNEGFRFLRRFFRASPSFTPTTFQLVNTVR